MSDFRIRGYRTDPTQRLLAKQRRDQLRDMGKCINAPLVGDVGRWGQVHGPVFRGGKCMRCCAVSYASSHARSAH